MGGVSRFLENAASIFEAAETASAAGHDLSDMAILIGAEGGIRMIADSDWPLDSLELHHGAQMAFRVSRRETSVRLEGRSGAKSCVLESARPEQIARVLLGALPRYEVVENRRLLTGPR